MNRNAPALSSPLRLSSNAPVSFRRARGLLLECLEGCVWITIDGQSGDHVLYQGESMTVQSDGLGLAEGMPDGLLRVSAPATQGAHWRLHSEIIPSST